MLRFNFAEKKESKYIKYVRPDLLFSLLVLLIVVAVTYSYTSSISEEINRTQQQIVKLRSEINRLSRIQRKEKELISVKKELQKKLEIVSQLDKNRKVPEFLYFFADPTNVKGIWLTDLHYSGRELHLTGGVLDIEAFPEFLGIVEDKLGKVTFKRTDRAVYSSRKLDFSSVYYRFTFDVELKNGSNH